MRFRLRSASPPTEPLPSPAPVATGLAAARSFDDRTGASDYYRLVLLGDPLPSEARDQRREDVAGSLGQHPDLFSTSRHQCRGGRVKQQDPNGQRNGLRLPQPRALQDGHLLSLWRPGSLSETGSFSMNGRPTTTYSGHPLETRKRQIQNSKWAGTEQREAVRRDQ